MKNQRLTLIIADNLGRPVRHLTLTPRVSIFGAAFFAALLAAAVGLLVHGLLYRSEATESRLIRHENRELHRTLDDVTARLPAIRHLAMRAEQAFAQLRVKSGLDLESRTLGVGPTENLNALQDGSDGLRSPIAPLTLDDAALPLEFDRIDQKGQVVLRALAETLEYFHDAERLLSYTPAIRPVKSAWISSTFGKRHDQIQRNLWVMHKGIDLAGQIGVEVLAPADGVVIFAGLRGGYGQTVVIDHGYGLQTHYGHLSGFEVKIGDHIRRGQVIALMGSTGKSTGPHLHFEVRSFGEPLDPSRFILD
jgi:murein DD-endopeptidase MepM/ murein hydrolase activator NlpD